MPVDEVPAPRCFACDAELSAPRSDEGLDPPLTPEHFCCVWASIRPQVDRLISRVLGTLPLAKLSARVGERCTGIARAMPGAVRSALARDASTIAEMRQEVAEALWKAVSRGGVRHARPVLFRWLETSVPRIVRRTSRSAALLALASAPTPDHADVEPAVAPILFGAGAEPEHVQAREAYRALLERRPGLLRELTDAERYAFLPWLEGSEPALIAKALGVSAVAVRLRLFHARARLDRCERTQP